MGRDRRPNGSDKERRRKKEQDDRKRRRSSRSRSSSSSTDEVMNGSRLRRSGRRSLKRLEARVAAGHEAFTALLGSRSCRPSWHGSSTKHHGPVARNTGTGSTAASLGDLLACCSTSSIARPTPRPTPRPTSRPTSSRNSCIPGGHGGWGLEQRGRLDR